MRNLAGDETAKTLCKEELELAGIPVYDCPADDPAKSEVPYKHFGHLNGWWFTRAWTYWIAFTLNGFPVLPFEYAQPLFDKHGQVVRTNGDCTCPSPRNQYEPSRGHTGVTNYHVDTQEGLGALAVAIRRWSQEKAPNAGWTNDEVTSLGYMLAINKK